MKLPAEIGKNKALKFCGILDFLRKYSANCFRFEGQNFTHYKKKIENFEIETIS